MRLRWRIAVFPLLVLMLGAPGARAADDSAPDGKAVYEEHCAACHGEQGDANTRVRRGLSPPPRDFTTPDAAAELSRERMINSTMHGRPGTAMMAFEERLSPARIEAVVDYIRETFLGRAAAGAAVAPALKLGEELYVRHCAVCHGDKGSGAMWTRNSLNPPPRDFTAPEIRGWLTRERMIASVTHGRRGTAMMSFSGRLMPHEIDTVVDYVRKTFMTGGPPAAGGDAHPSTPVRAADMNAPFPGGLRGDPGKGREFYMRNCITCHGERGDGRGPRSTFINPKPRDFLDPDSRQRLNRPALFTAVSNGLTGTVMPSWNKVLSPQEIADASEFVFRAFIRGDPAALADKKKLD